MTNKIKMLARKIGSIMEKILEEGEEFSGIVTEVLEGRDNLTGSLTLYTIQGIDKVYFGGMKGWKKQIKIGDQIQGRVKSIESGMFGEVYGVITYTLNEKGERKYWPIISKYSINNIS